MMTFFASFGSLGSKYFYLLLKPLLIRLGLSVFLLRKLAHLAVAHEFKRFLHTGIGLLVLGIRIQLAEAHVLRAHI